ncbi:unnamed protein product [Meloidogyne enterolobii]|uniref:Uncharacterized protein n=1 Tax=Meloidogyne enterolobii TaxID=390850 RepID=A0ACB1AHX7_MELEN
MEENEEEREDEEDEVNDEEEEGDVEEQGVEMEENEEAELEDEEIEVECQEPSKSVEIQLVSTAKEFSKNLSRKSSKLSSNLPPKRIFSSVCEEVEEGQNVIHLDSASFIQQQSCSRIRQSLSTAKEASSIQQTSSLNTARNISFRRQHTFDVSSCTLLHHFFDASQTINATQSENVLIFEEIQETSKSTEKSFSPARGFLINKIIVEYEEISTRNLEELENTPPPSTSQQHQPRQQAIENLNRNASIRNSRRLSLSPWSKFYFFKLKFCSIVFIPLLRLYFSERIFF